MTTSYNPFSLFDKTILIVGASSGIGQETAIEASKMGASLILMGRNNQRLSETIKQLEGSNHSYFTLDITDSDAVENVIQEFPRLDGVVISSGITDIAPIKFSTKNRFQKVFETNFFAPVDFIRILLKKKKINDCGSIVILSSIGGISKTSLANGMYGASKAALTSWTKFLAQEVAQKQIRANCVCPGMTETPLIKSGLISQEQLDVDKHFYPLKRYGNPKEIGWAVIYLLSDASKWVTGTNLFIDGGISI